MQSWFWSQRWRRSERFSCVTYKSVLSNLAVWLFFFLHCKELMHIHKPEMLFNNWERRPFFSLGPESGETMARGPFAAHEDLNRPAKLKEIFVRAGPVLVWTVHITVSVLYLSVLLLDCNLSFKVAHCHLLNRSKKIRGEVLSHKLRSSPASAVLCCERVLPCTRPQDCKMFKQHRASWACSLIRW